MQEDYDVIPREVDDDNYQPYWNGYHDGEGKTQRKARRNNRK